MSRAATRTCSAISRALRLRLIPSSPLAQTLRQARRLLPVAHEGDRQSGVGLGQTVGRFAPLFEGLLYFGQKLGGSHGEMLARWPGRLAGPPRLRTPRSRLSFESRE